MLTQLNPRERFGYVVLIGLTLFAFGFIGMKQLKKPTEIKVEPLAAPTAALKEASNEAVIHVAGAVKNPGMARLSTEDRVEDAIKACGGAVQDADLEAINLAARLEDGTQLYVPRKSAPEPEKVAEPYRGGGSEAYKASPVSSSAVRPAASTSKNPAPKSVSLNSATQAQFESLPGIGPATAQKILEYRKAHGGFSSVDELLAVKGIGPKKLEAMKPYLKL